MKLYILASYEPKITILNPHPSETKIILDTYFNVPTGGRKLDPKVEAMLMQSQLDLKQVQKYFNDQGERGTVLAFEVLVKPRTPWVSGEYYASEYSAYVDGRARLVHWTDSFFELEVECLDKSKKAMDGLWPYSETVSAVQSNGCGDKFYPIKSLIKKAK